MHNDHCLFCARMTEPHSFHVLYRKTDDRIGFYTSVNKLVMNACQSAASIRYY